MGSVIETDSKAWPVRMLANVSGKNGQKLKMVEETNKEAV